MKLLLFSGGVESTCLAAVHRPDLLLTVDYGQICYEGEARAATYLASKLGLMHDLIRASVRDLGLGDLAGESSSSETSEVTESWPFRNQFLITVAAMRYERHGLREILIGAVKSDCVHPDGNPQFIDAMSSVLASQNCCLGVSAPAISMTTLELVHTSGLSRDILGWTFSCHRASVACGRCRGCNKTIQLFRDLEAASQTTSESDTHDGQ